MALTEQLANHIAGTSFEKIPTDVVKETKKYVLDTLAAGIAGSDTHIVHTLVDQLMYWGGRQQSSVWGLGGHLPAPAAALANATMVHGYDLDAVHDDAIVHAYTAVVPAALAITEERRADGKTFLASVILASDIGVRLGLATRLYKGFILTSTLGGFAAATAAAKALNLSTQGVINTWGIMYGQTAGNRQTFIDAGASTRFQPGFASRSGVMSGYFAERGLTGATQVFEGPYGYFKLYCESPDPAIDEMTRELGTRFEGINVSIKPYPSCRGTHGPINATLEILKRFRLTPDQVDEVIVHAPMNETGIFKNIGRPFVLRPDPHVDAQYSIPYTVAAAIVRNDMFLPELEEAVIRTPRILELSDRVHVVTDQPVDNGKALAPVEVEIKIKDGQSYVHRINYIKGHPNNPLSWDDVVVKFKKCVDFAKPRGVKSADRVVDLIANLEQVKDMSELTRLVSEG